MRILLLLLILTLPNCGGEDTVLETIRQRERQRHAIELERMRQGIDKVIEETNEADLDCWDHIEFVDMQ